MVMGVWNLLVPKNWDSFGFCAWEKSVPGSRHCLIRSVFLARKVYE